MFKRLLPVLIILSHFKHDSKVRGAICFNSLDETEVSNFSECPNVFAIFLEKSSLLIHDSPAK